MYRVHLLLNMCLKMNKKLMNFTRVFSLIFLYRLRMYVTENCELYPLCYIFEKYIIIYSTKISNYYEKKHAYIDICIDIRM